MGFARLSPDNPKGFSMSFDVDKIAAQVKDALTQLEQNSSGGVAGLQFFNFRNEALHAELHTRDGVLVYLGLHSAPELQRQREAQAFVARNRGD